MSQSRLFAKLLENEITDAERGQLNQLNQLLHDDPELRRLYRKYMTLDAMLRWEIAPPLMRVSEEEREAADSPVGGINPESGVSVPSIVVDSSPSGFTFVGSMAFSYMVATIVLCAMLLSAWAYRVTHRNAVPDGFVQNDSVAQEMEFVARITAAVDCNWDDPNKGTLAGAWVTVGRKYALTSGLMEITYKSGAKVILEGPCAYTVDSSSGGYLSLGKMTALISVPPAPYPSSPSSLFSIKTPTAVVTDLGTEFGVEVDALGNTTSHVFQGLVRFQAIGGGSPKSVMLRKNDTASAQIGPRGTTVSRVAAPSKFVRRMVEPPKIIDLLDIVAGGNGTGNHRERGINPRTGYQQTAFAPSTWQDDGQFRAVTWHRFIDGVFVPNYHSGSVQIDSAKHTFDGTFGGGGAYGSIWARAAEPPSNEYANDPSYWVYVVGSDKAFMPDRRGLLCMHANAGITFDLKEIRLAYPDSTPSGFHAVAGMFNAGLHTEWSDGWADIWILVDGKLKLKREKILSKDGGPFNVDVALKPSDRFLTIISTDGGIDHGTARDWIAFGDPVLRMTPVLDETIGKEDSTP